MNVKLSPFVQKEITKINKKDKKLAKKISKQILLFTKNPKHPSLRLHKLTGRATSIWSISINMSVRMLYKLQDEDSAYFVDIGTHDEVYGKGN